MTNKNAVTVLQWGTVLTIICSPLFAIAFIWLGYNAIEAISWAGLICIAGPGQIAFVLVIIMMIFFRDEL